MWLVLDCPFLCYRLAWAKQLDDLPWGFFRTLSALHTKFGPDRTVFCWDHRHLFRRDLYPGYKLREKNHTKEEIEQRRLVHVQMAELRERHLPNLGFQNICYARGLESDDWMAKLASLGSSLKEEVLLVTSDADMYQCLGPYVSIHNPNAPEVTLFTDRSFKKKYGIRPRNWPTIKAVAGCPSDHVPGVKGVGLKTALKWHWLRLAPKSVASRRIFQFIGSPAFDRNMKLVALPWNGDYEVKKPMPDKMNRKLAQKWNLHL